MKVLSFDRRMLDARARSGFRSLKSNYGSGEAAALAQ
jgi:hypothetical protein